MNYLYYFNVITVYIWPLKSYFSFKSQISVKVQHKFFTHRGYISGI